MSQAEQDISNEANMKRILQDKSTSGQTEADINIDQKSTTSIEEEKIEDQEIRREIEKAMEARRAYIQKECMGAKKRLDLGCSNIDDLDAYTIAMCLNEKEPVLELLHLGSNKLSGEGLRVILTGLQWHCKLKELYLGNNKFDLDALEDLIEALPIFQELQILSLGNIGLDDNLGVLLISSLEMLKNLKSVLLNSNPISDKTFVKLSTMIAKNQLSCTTLHLGETKPTIIGLIALFQSLEDDKILKNLFLNDILIPTDAAKALNKTLVRNSCLEQLNFGNCEIDDEIISLIKFGLMCNQNVKSIYLWKNCITNEGLFLIKRILEDHNFVLIGIILSDNLVDDEDLLNEVKVLLKRNEKLDNISVRLDNALQIWETINCLKDNPEHLIKAENIEKENRISVIEREINEAERKIEEAKKNLLILKQL